jgi:hypothetical protein
MKTSSWAKESIACNQRTAEMQELNQRNQGRYKVGMLVQVLTKASDHHLLTGRVVEVTRFNDSGMVEFAPAMLQQASDPARVAGFKRPVHFYWRELKQVKWKEIARKRLEYLQTKLFKAR